MQHSSKHIALAFLLGALVTGGALGFTAARVIDREARTRPTVETMRERLKRELELSEEQTSRFDEILDRRDRKLDSLLAPIDARMDSLRPTIRAVRDDARRELRAVLSAPQQREFDEYLAVMREKARRDSIETANRRSRGAASGAPTATTPGTE